MARFAFFGKLRRLVCTGGKARIAAPAPSARCADKFLPGLDQIGEGSAAVGIAHHCSEWHLDAKIVGGGSCLARTATPLAVIGSEMVLAAEGDQGVHRWRRHQDHVAAVPAIAAIRPAAWYKFFAAKMAHAVATVAALECDRCFIKKHAGSLAYPPQAVNPASAAAHHTENVVFGRVAAKQDPDSGINRLDVEIGIDPEIHQRVILKHVETVP